MDRRWYVDVNRFARATGWAHGFMVGYYERLLSPVGAGLVVLAALLLAGWWSARRQPQHVAATLWAAIAALVALGLSEALVQVLAERRPYAAVRGAEVLVKRGTGYAFPSPRAAAAAALATGLGMARRWRLAAVAAPAALLLMFAGVYVGVDYPSDAAAGGALGLLVAVLLWPLASWVLVPVVSTVGTGPAGRLVVARGSVDRTRPRADTERAPRLPDARAMEALRAASEAARHARLAPPEPTTAMAIKVVSPGDGRGNGQEAGS